MAVNLVTEIVSVMRGTFGLEILVICYSTQVSDRSQKFLCRSGKTAQQWEFGSQHPHQAVRNYL